MLSFVLHAHSKFLWDTKTQFSRLIYFFLIHNLLLLLCFCRGYCYVHSRHDTHTEIVRRCNKTYLFEYTFHCLIALQGALLSLAIQKQWGLRLKELLTPHERDWKREDAEVRRVQCRKSRCEQERLQYVACVIWN